MKQSRTRSLLLLVAIILASVSPLSAGSITLTPEQLFANSTTNASLSADKKSVILTDTLQRGESGSLIYNTVFAIDPAHALSGYFDYFSGLGTGADGLSFFLLDATAPGWSGSQVTTGAQGSSLGYAQRCEGQNCTSGSSIKGITGGYLGVGLDEFGLAASSYDGHNGAGAGWYSNWVSIRGCAITGGSCTTSASMTGYNYLTGRNTGRDLDSLTAGQFWRVSFTFAPTGSNLLLTMGLQLRSPGDINPDSNPVTMLYQNTAINAGGPLPAKVAVGWSASTGMATNVHSIGSFRLNYGDPTDSVPEPGTYLLMAGGLLFLWGRRRAA